MLISVRTRDRSLLLGYGVCCAFIAVNLYLMDTYETYTASALACCVFMRYMTSGIIVMATSPVHLSFGTKRSCILFGSIAAGLAPVPYLLYFFGPSIRKRSMFVNKLAGGLRRK
jgi:hypothetical protein